MRWVIGFLFLAASMPALASQRTACQNTLATASYAKTLQIIDEEIYFPSEVEYFKSPRAHFYARFSPHQDSSLEDTLKVLDKLISSGEESVAAERLREIINDPENIQLITSLNEDRNSLITALQNNDIQWLGVEYYEGEIESPEVDFETNMRMYAHIKTHAAKVLEAREVNNLMVLVTRPEILAQIKKPKLFEDVATVHIDSPHKEVGHLLIQKFRSLRELVLLQTGEGLTLSAKDYFKITSYIDRKFNLGEYPAIEEVEPLLRLAPDNYLGNILEDLFLTINAWAEMKDERDRHLAKAITQQQGLGFVILGAAHRAGVLNNLGIDSNPR